MPILTVQQGLEALLAQPGVLSILTTLREHAGSLIDELEAQGVKEPKCEVGEY